MHFPTDIVLASGSPRRQSILSEMGISFEVILHTIDEDFPSSLKGSEVALYLANKKAMAYDSEVESGKTVITADTIVCINNEILNKPGNAAEAFTMLQSLSGKTHEVITAVCIRNKKKTKSFATTTRVTFKVLSKEEVDYYIETCKPFDKAGGYGIQEWIGMIGISAIEGSYYNVVGFPAHEVYQNLVQMAANPAS